MYQITCQAGTAFAKICPSLQYECVQRCWVTLRATNICGQTFKGFKRNCCTDFCKLQQGMMTDTGSGWIKVY